MSTPRHDELPLADYDHLPAGSLEHRIRSLTAGQVEELLAYERGHADRAQVVQVLTARLDQLASGSVPSGGDQDGPRPEQAPPPASGSPVSPATTPEPTHPPPHGTLDQRGKPKGDRRP
ncbi:hypothetical protein WDH52_05445 [Streptomyces sp. TRM70308]|uniref:hypothetical protein n=1 Tax=Streptomyces sp. TRM70308 TaxID=3131932 RepID=UPI003CFE6CD2